MNARAAKGLIAICCALFFGWSNAESAECDAKQDDEDALVVAVYAELPGAAEADLRRYEKDLLTYLENHTDSEKTVEFCMITKAIFPTLGTTNLMRFNAVRKMLLDKTELANGKTIAEKLGKFKVQYLVLVTSETTENPARPQSNFNVVRIDPSGNYPRKGGFADFSAPVERSEFFKILTKNMSGMIQPRKFPVVIVCFEDRTQGRAREDWDMEFMTRRIPDELAQWLVREKKYAHDRFPVRFEGSCEIGTIDRKWMNSKFGGDEGFVWTGTIFFRGLKKIAVEVRFVHLVNETEVKGNGLWENDYNTSPWTVHNEIAPKIAGQWERYLQETFKKYRQGVALPPDIEPQP